MRLNHINLVVSDVEAAVNFFVAYFDFKCTEIKGGYAIAILNGSDDFTLVIMKGKEAAPVYPGAFHIGFMQDSAEKVNEIYQKLKMAGIVDGREPGKIRDSFGFYFNFENLMIEVGYYISGDNS